MSGTGPFQKRMVLAGSPSAVFRTRIAAELAAGTIPCACPHPVTADRLWLPSRTLRCAECDMGVADQPESNRGPCASCGVPDARGWSIWVDEVSHVEVLARICETCGTSGTLPVPGLN
jgi:hypothetical protein